MPHGSVIWTYFEGDWHEGSVPIIKAADIVTWNGNIVFDGARQYNGVVPDLDLHCQRVNRSALALNMSPTQTPEVIADLVRDGLKRFADDAAVYVRPMYWSIEPGEGFITGDPEATGFAIVLEQIDMPPETYAATLTTTQFCRPMLTMATVDAKASCLYPNNQRMVREAIAKGFTNALVADPLGNVAETATSNIFMVRASEVFTPVPNGTFLNGITRQRHISLLREAGKVVHETTLTFDDFRSADEVFMSGNVTKVTPVSAFDDVLYQSGPITRLARKLYWDWACSA